MRAVLVVLSIVLVFASGVAAFPKAHELFNYGPNGEPYAFRHYVRDARRQYSGSEYAYREDLQRQARRDQYIQKLLLT